MKLSPTDMLLMVRSSSLGMNRINSTAKSGMKMIKVSSCSIYNPPQRKSAFGKPLIDMLLCN